MLQPGVQQVNTMLTAAELEAALDAVSVQVTALGRQLEEAADREAKEMVDAKVGSWVVVWTRADNGGRPVRMPTRRSNMLRG